MWHTLMGLLYADSLLHSHIFGVAVAHSLGRLPCAKPQPKFQAVFERI